MDISLHIENVNTLNAFAKKLGSLLVGGEVLELVGDVGAGKTTFVKALAEGLQVDEVVQSPTFTISRLYHARDGLELHHYDFYRLQEPGVLKASLGESLFQSNVITALEWDDSVRDILPEDRTVALQFAYVGDDAGARELTIHFPEQLLPLAQKLQANEKAIA